jgi:hypothetical protein
LDGLEEVRVADGGQLDPIDRLAEVALQIRSQTEELTCVLGR